jgi:Na+/H+ antiporter NhaD/arsenite permease-like protein
MLRGLVRKFGFAVLMLVLVSFCSTLMAADGTGTGVPNKVTIGGIHIEFLIFAGTLLMVAMFHHYVLPIAVTGLTVVVITKLAFHLGIGHEHLTGINGLMHHVEAEWVTIANLLCLLVGFDILSHHFKDSKIPDLLPNYLPNGYWGSFTLLVLVFFLSSFLDNIAAAMIGGSIAGTVFKGKVHIGYLAGIVAASNAGGAGSVVGDTTTTMMWIDGVNPFDVLHAYVGSFVALLIFGTIASAQQNKYQPIESSAPQGIKIQWNYLFAVMFILASAITANVVANVYFPDSAESAPWIGMAVWIGIFLMLPIAKPHWDGVPPALKGSIFLLSLVMSASMMPVEELPPASAGTALTLGFVSAVFDNIPLTKLALEQGGYDWGYLAFAVGFGGSMIWFGSSAGVALSNSFEEAKSVGNWIKNGWHVALAYVVGFGVLYFVMGWHPHQPHKTRHNIQIPGITTEHAHGTEAAPESLPSGHEKVPDVISTPATSMTPWVKPAPQDTPTPETQDPVKKMPEPTTLTPVKPVDPSPSKPVEPSVTPSPEETTAPVKP